MTANIILYKSLETLALLLGATSALFITRLPAWGQGTETTPFNLQFLYPPAVDWFLPPTPTLFGPHQSPSPLRGGVWGEVSSTERPTPTLFGPHQSPSPLRGEVSSTERPTQSSYSAEDLKSEGLERLISQQRQTPPTQPQRPELETIQEELDEDPDFAIVPLPRYSSIKGIHGTLDLILTNLGENNQTLDLRLEGGERTIGATFRYTDPWLESGPFDSGYQVRLFNTRSPESRISRRRSRSQSHP